MSDEIRLRERAGTVPVPPTETEPNSTPIVEPPRLSQQSSQPPSASAQMSVVHYLDKPLYHAKGWIQLMGIVFILNGVFMALSLVGIILCWLPIWLGLTLMSAAKNIRVAAELDNQEYLYLALDKIGLFFKIHGILIVIGLVVAAVIGAAAALGVLGSLAMLSQGVQNMPQ
ncbi:MAG: DUF5362 domain-containing protein [Phycisphaerales bacterium]|nr:MAG: DUF5362 domain-containing protein [Phycisphaerales bacterium]